MSRTTFSDRNGYRAVLLQQGRVVLDADFNEQADLTAHHDEVRTTDVVGRVGGPLPADPAAPGPFAIRATDGTVPKDTPWADLVVTPGRYYVDGVLTESFPTTGPGWSLTAQPFGALLEPPAGASRYALYLEVTDHEVTSDEAPKLRESALGGPDTSVRRQTSWQVRWAELGTEVCSDLDASWLARTPRAMVAGLKAVPPAADPCRIVAADGFQGLENQLYRVQVFDVDSSGSGRYVWSRENGSVVAAALALGSTTVADADARLSVDREGRDAELDIAVGALVELTSTDRQLQRVPGYLATVIERTGLDLDVAWLDAGPAALADLGAVPIVRRWEGGPTKLGTGAVELEDGITVRFPNGGVPRVGDYWQVPARAVQLAYGLAGTSGTIEWPPPWGVASGSADAVAPLGPISRIAPLGIVERTVGGSGQGLWTLASDCRRLFPPLTGLVTLDLVGGDGQESLPGAWLDEPVRVVVRNGVRPVEGARVLFAASDAGALGVADPPTSVGASEEVLTDADGVASVRWQLNAAGPVTQVLSVQRLDDKGNGFDVEVRATARLSLASQVAFERDGCAVFEGVSTVEGALNRLATRVELRLQGGDGQEVLPGRRRVLPQPIRVIADSPCGPVSKVPVNARATDGAHVKAAVEGEDAPFDLSNEPDVADAETGADGAALFWWQPGKQPSDTLEVRLPGDDPHAPIVVSAQWEREGEGGGRLLPGAHIVEVAFGTGKPFLNDDDVRADELASGVTFRLDEDLPDEMNGKPVIRVELELPWPIPGDGDPWAMVPVGTRAVEVEARVLAKGPELHWRPRGAAREWLMPEGGLWSVGEVLRREGVRGRIMLDGWGVRTAAEHAVNTHAELVFEGGRLVYQLPTDDLVPGGTFTQWFMLRPPDAEVREVPNFVGMVLEEAHAVAKEMGYTRVVVEPAGHFGDVIAQRPEPGTPSTTTTLVVLSAGGQG
ncbi:DUF6519 domain-containing protein [Propioniciclava sinopodophylli]|uniref:DUF6519 domain-containing protein n=1 Tax=Propioniciclava sinopodophylli TaxID=1837344 RepID=UPI00249292EF|nr:DUF6519 domain-containing protein [Propioniciclava sinopodophylli]